MNLSTFQVKENFTISAACASGSLRYRLVILKTGLQDTDRCLGAGNKCYSMGNFDALSVSVHESRRKFSVRLIATGMDLSAGGATVILNHWIRHWQEERIFSDRMRSLQTESYLTNGECGKIFGNGTEGCRVTGKRN